ncbi:MAG: L-serine ammonia-lyase, iron-sulfur-dependent, subunit alpha, partial [Candidatus Izemoplasmatales bacterium]|nr:L-serine ammonia-lyase, iron-sulfur-dependent, subunit alpha [Candidatus Izemoplasmatales bacterium]
PHKSSEGSDDMPKMELYDTYWKILSEELVPALGCTEPISVAYASAKARDILKATPVKIFVRASESLIKNIRSVSVPYTRGLTGVEASVIAGLVGGNPTKGLQVLSQMNDAQHIEIARLLEKNIVHIARLDTQSTLHYIIRFESQSDSVEVEVKDVHTHITRITKNGEDIYHSAIDTHKYFGILTDRSVLSVPSIIDFAKNADLETLKHMFKPMIDCNIAVAEAGLSGNFGVGIGSTILKNDSSLSGKIKAYASAASEARMCGSELAVITNSGSGNQGISASVPVIVYAREQGIPEEPLYRALALSNLLTIHQKTTIGRLSAFCGAISACCSAGAAFTYLAGGSDDQIEMTITNFLADAPGILCDGAKASCAAKIATGMEAAIISHHLAMEHKRYPSGCGIIQGSADETIAAVGKIAQEGMKDTNTTIVDVMLPK